MKKVSEIKQAYEESENSFASGLRTVTDMIGSCRRERDGAGVVMRSMDPDFREGFERELREHIVPEGVDACLSADREVLKAWCGEAVSFSSYESIRGADKRSNRHNVLWAYISAEVSSAPARCSTSDRLT